VCIAHAELSLATAHQQERASTVAQALFMIDGETNCHVALAACLADTLAYLGWCLWRPRARPAGLVRVGRLCCAGALYQPGREGCGAPCSLARQRACSLAACKDAKRRGSMQQLEVTAVCTCILARGVCLAACISRGHMGLGIPASLLDRQPFQTPL